MSRCGAGDRLAGKRLPAGDGGDLRFGADDRVDAEAKASIRRASIRRVSAGSLVDRVSKMTLPLAMNVSTRWKPSDSKAVRSASILTLRPPTLTARKKAT